MHDLTLFDIARRTAPGTEYEAVAEILAKVNPILKMLPFKECNNGTVNKEPIRTGYPKGFWRKYYQGIPQETSSYATVQDDCGMLTAMSMIDCDLIDHSGRKAQMLLDESRGFIEGLSQTMATTFFYGDSKADPEKFTGLTPRYAKHSGALDTINYNVVSNGGTTANKQTSIWCVSNDVTKLFGLYPKGSKAGLRPEDLGRQLVLDGSGNRYTAYVKEYKWDCGFGIKDWRYCARLCNVEIDALTGTTLIDNLVKLTNKLPPDAKDVCLYCNRDVITALDIMAMNKTNVHLTMTEWDGHKITSFRGYPVLRTDALVNTEKVVAAA